MGHGDGPASLLTHCCMLGKNAASLTFTVVFKSDHGQVSRQRDCTMCRECIREPGWSEKVSLSRIADHFIFNIESVGMLPPKVKRSPSCSRIFHLVKHRYFPVHELGVVANSIDIDKDFERVLLRRWFDMNRRVGVAIIPSGVKKMARAFRFTASFS